MTDPAQPPTERDALIAQFGLVPQTIPVGPHTMRLLRVANPTEVIDAVTELDEDERIPYWVELWPATLGLVRWLGRTPDLVRGQWVLDLGCGLGAVAMAASLLGAARVVAADYDADAVRVAALNARENGLANVQAVRMDWRAPALARRFSVILAADVLYEARFFLPVLDALSVLLRREGAAYLAEPGREVANVFFDLARERGWAVRRMARERITAGGASPTVTTYRLRRLQRD